MHIVPLMDYNIYLGPLEESLPGFLRQGAYSGIFVIVDDNTLEHCWPKLAPLLMDREHKLMCITPGERHKNIDTCRRIWSAMFEAGLDRRALVLNLGGGVIGDMGGFCAATYKRGIDFTQIPTTLLAQVDASIGGKLGIDFARLKNSIGVFRDPVAVFIDPAFLDTLPPRELRGGFAEIIKHSLIADAGQWRRIERLERLESIDWAALIADSLRIKQRIVAQDPLERGPRKALNFGHTIGHAAESWALENDYSLLHGEAVAAGMISEAYLAHHWLGLPSDELETISVFLRRIYAPQVIDPRCFPELLRLMRDDKKNENQHIQFALISAPGQARVDCHGPDHDILDSLHYFNEVARGG